MHDYDSLSPQSRVWVYQANRPLLLDEIPTINEAIAKFTTGWVAHNVALKAFGKVYHNRFIVLMVDETGQSATGCSIDKSVKFLQQLEEQLGISLFDRLHLAYEMDGGIATIHKDDLDQALEAGQLHLETPVFNNLVQTKAEFEQQWRIPLRDSWAGQMMNA